jgi:hypothetical protein
MTTALAVSRENASIVPATTRGEVSDAAVIEIVRDKSQRAKWFPGLAKKLSKDKPSAAVHHLTGEKERTCYDWCGGAVDPPSRALIKLLHSAAGWIVLEYLMRGCEQPWWRAVLRARKCAAAYDQESEQFEMSF